jgi:copper chaperone
MIELDVTGMTCQHCVRAVSDALSEVPGVTRVVSVDLNGGRAAVEGDPNPQDLIAAVQEAGYEAHLRQA